ncbi:hypothetical protein PENTCL1PPCAC_27098, partial [Pristionchus entomophagus]
MNTIAELMDLAEIPRMEDYADAPHLHTRSRNKNRVKNEFEDLEDIEEEEGERKLLFDRMLHSETSDDSNSSEQHDPNEPIAGTNTALAPRVVSPPSHLQMDATTRARVFGRKFIGPQEANVVSCHRCDAPMRICVRKLKYVDHVKEYPSYRCTRKGCQTFKSMRVVEQPHLERARRVTGNLKTTTEEKMGLTPPMLGLTPLNLVPSKSSYHVPMHNPYPSIPSQSWHTLAVSSTTHHPRMALLPPPSL